MRNSCSQAIFFEILRSTTCDIEMVQRRAQVRITNDICSAILKGIPRKGEGCEEAAFKRVKITWQSVTFI